MSFLSELSSLDGNGPGQTLLLQQWIASRPRELFAELRVDRPILSLAGLVLVTRHADIVDILARDREFGVTAYAPKMHRATGDFFLGMENGPVYEREVSIMRLASSRHDLARIEQSIGDWANFYVSAKAASGRLDVVADVARRVPGQLVADYFGVSGPDEAARLRWLRALFRDIFINPGDRDPEVTSAAAIASSELSLWLDAHIEELAALEKAGGTLPDNVLARCVAMQSVPATALDTIGIRRNISGLIVGAVDTTSTSIANLLDYLLDHPDLLAQAGHAAREGTLADVRGFVFEALRFKPQAPILTRFSLETATLAHGTDRETLVPAGTVVLVALMSGMLDAEELDQPDDFNPSRPSQHYLHFGHGLHQCFGRHINALQLPLIAKAILKLPGLRRAEGEEGSIKYDGPFPDHLVVKFDPV